MEILQLVRELMALCTEQVREGPEPASYLFAVVPADTDCLTRSSRACHNSHIELAGVVGWAGGHMDVLLSVSC